MFYGGYIWWGPRVIYNAVGNSIEGPDVRFSDYLQSRPLDTICLIGKSLGVLRLPDELRSPSLGRGYGRGLRSRYPFDGVYPER